MADYFTGASFIVTCAPAEAEALVEAINNPDTAEDRFFDDPEFKSFDATAEIDEGGVWIYGEEWIQVYYLALLIQHLAPSALPMGFTFASTCTKPRLDAYDGGYVLITADAVEVKSASDQLAERLSE